MLTKLTDQDFAESHIACVVSYGASKSDCELPHIVHAAQGAANHGKDDRKSGSNIVVHSYGTPSPYFVIPGYSTYHPGSAAIAHTRTLVFLRKHLGGPCFDIEKVWDEHTYFEFEVRSVAKTMATMVVSTIQDSVNQMGSRRFTERAIRQPCSNGKRFDDKLNVCSMDNVLSR